MKTAHTFTTFQAWLDAVDIACVRRAGVSIHDLPDCCYRDWFDDGDSPSRAAGRAIRMAKDGDE